LISYVIFICFFSLFNIIIDIMKFDKLTPESEVLAELGRRLATLRKQQGFSQTALAEEAGIGVATLRRIEGGQDSQMESWLKLLKALNYISAVEALLPAEIKSPRAQVQAGRSKKSPPTSTWGDET